MHYYQHHIGDFIRDTAQLNDHQLATYLRMIWIYYDSEKPISDEIEDIAFSVRSDEKTVGLILRHYFKKSPEGWSHARCDKEISEYKARGDKARQKANARWSNATALPQHSHSNAAAMPQHRKTGVLDANQEPITNNQEKEKEREGATDAADAAPRSRAIAIPADFPTDADLAWCDTERPELSAATVAVAFRDYHLAHGSTMKSWPAAWRTWVRKERVAPAAAHRATSAADRQAEAIYRITGGLAGKPSTDERVIDVESFRQRQLAGR